MLLCDVRRWCVHCLCSDLTVTEQQGDSSDVSKYYGRQNGNINYQEKKLTEKWKVSFIILYSSVEGGHYCMATLNMSETAH